MVGRLFATLDIHLGAPDFGTLVLSTASNLNAASEALGGKQSAMSWDVTRLVRVAETIRDTGYQFVTITPASHAIVNARSANAVAQNLQDIFGWSRPFSEDLLPSNLFSLLCEAELLVPEGKLWRSVVRLSSLNGDLFMHSAFPTSSRDAVFFGPDTYKFVDAINLYLARRSSPVARAADLCSGAGPGALAIAKMVPDAAVFSLDINAKALRLAAVNAVVAKRPHVTARHSDLLSGISGALDLITAHPPYLIDRDSRAYRHGGGPLGAALSLAIVEAAIPRLAPGGTLLLFTGIAMVGGSDPFLGAIVDPLDGADLAWSYREVDPDVFGEELSYEAYRETDRIALVVLTVTKRKSP